jgi:hypothetical protein
MMDDVAIPGMGGDAGAGGGDGGGGAAVAEPEVTPGAEGTPAPEGAPAEGGEPTPEGGEPKPETPPEETDPEAGLHEDSRIVDVKTRQQIAELRKTNPALAKVASDAIFGRQAVMKEFPEAKSIGDVLKSVRAQRATLEAVGGEEGITKLNEEVTDYRKEIDQFAAGDRELPAQLLEANPDGFVKTVDNSLQLLLEKYGAEPGGRFDQVLAVPFAQRINDAGMPQAIAALIDHVKAGDGEAAYAKLQLIDKWLKNVDAYAKKVGEGRAAAPDPREQKLSEREQNIERAETERYEASIGADVNKLNNSALQPLLDGVFKQIPELKAEGKQRFTHMVQSEVWKAMKADKVFQRNARAVMAKKDPAASARFINAKFAELLNGPDGIFIKVRNEMYPNIGRAKKPAIVPKPAAANGQPAKVAYAGGRPKFQDVSWESEGGKTSDIMWIRGEAILKDGKQIKFDPNSPPNRL